MPELPEVEAVCRRLRAEALGASILEARILRPGIAVPQKAAAIERALSGRTLRAVERRGKNILLRCSQDVTLRVHLRMTGNLYVVPDYRLRSATVRMALHLSGGRGVVFDDPRALGRVSLHADGELPSLLSAIGPEPLSAEFTPAAFLASARRSRKPAKLYLMDQASVAGLGNIYAAEALYQARIDPRKPMMRISPARLQTLHHSIVEVLRAAVESAVRAYAQPGRFTEAEAYPVAVYGREGEPCFRCGKAIRRIPQGGRSTYFCPHCQR